MKPGGGRAKGHAFEREVANAVKPVYPGARRGLSQTRAGGEVPDVDFTPWWFEAKRGRRTDIKAAMRQAQAATDGRPPVVVSKDDRAEPLVTMTLADWLALVARLDSAVSPLPTKTDPDLTGPDK